MIRAKNMFTAMQQEDVKWYSKEMIILYRIALSVLKGPCLLKTVIQVKDNGTNY